MVASSLRAASTTAGYAGPPGDVGWPAQLWDTQRAIRESQAQAASPSAGLFGACDSSRGSGALVQPARPAMVSWTRNSRPDHANVLLPLRAGPSGGQSSRGPTLWRSLRAASTTAGFAGSPGDELWDTQRAIRESQAQAASPSAGLCGGAPNTHRSLLCWHNPRGHCGQLTLKLLPPRRPAVTLRQPPRLRRPHPASPAEPAWLCAKPDD